MHYRSRIIKYEEPIRQRPPSFPITTILFYHTPCEGLQNKSFQFFSFPSPFRCDDLSLRHCGSNDVGRQPEPRRQLFHKVVSVGMGLSRHWV